MENISQNPNSKNNTTIKTYVSDERMAGGYSKHTHTTKPQEKQGFNNVLLEYNSQNKPINNPIKISENNNKENEFGFLDIIDMVNPLQHIPIVNLAYREITGDEIKPASKIIGGGIFGGPLGAASGIVDTIVKQETGKDIIGNASSFIGGHEKRTYDLEEYYAYEDLPASLLAFAETPLDKTVQNSNIIGNTQPPPNGNNNHKQNTYERIELAQGRTAGTIAVYS